MTEKTAPEFLTVAEAAERMNVPERFIRRLIYERRIPHTKLGRSRQSPVRIAVADVDAFLAESRVEAVGQ